MMIHNPTFPRIRTGSDDFLDLITHSDVFVDKSLMIQALLEDSSKVILITRPRRWGKSLNMSMIQKFFEIEVDEQGIPLPKAKKLNALLFTGGRIDLGIKGKKTLSPLKIHANAYAMDQQGNYPVMLFNLKDVKGSSYQEIERGIKDQMIALFSQHRYLRVHLTETSDLLDNAQKEKLQCYLDGKLDKSDLKQSLRFLSELLYKHFNQSVYILIDEYDTPINSAYIKFGKDTESFEEVLELFRGLLGSALKSNPYLEKGVITGILRIAKANLFSDLNNVREYTLLDKKFSKFYGFTQEEVDDLLTKVPTPTTPEKIKDWYNGYTFGGEISYNPWSIMQCLASEGALDYYWLDSGGTGLVDKVLLEDHIQEDIQTLLEGKALVKKVYKQLSLERLSHNKDLLYSLLVFAGYLNPMLVDHDPENPKYSLTIPNKEVRAIYVERVVDWVAQKLQMDPSDHHGLIGLLRKGALEAFFEQFSTHLLHATSYHDLSSEKDCHNLMGGLLAPLVSHYHLLSNQEVGHGRCDHMVIPLMGKGAHAFVLEYKVAKNKEALASVARTGLQQIIQKQYVSKIKTYPHVQKITQIAMAFCGKSLAWVYQTE